MRRKRVSTILFLMALTLGLVSSLSLAQGEGPQDTSTTAPNGAMGTAFTYQGSLSDGAGPVTGACDFTFRLYYAQTGGNLLGTESLDDVQVVDGLFTARLDFGASPFRGAARWLEIEVDCGAGPATLAPRQELTPVPYALYAVSAPGDGDTTYQAGTGLALTGTTFSVANTYRLPQGCKDG